MPRKIKLITIETYKIAPNPMQPRREFDAEKLEELSRSIALHGLIQPITVRRRGRGYELVAGERRLRAAKMAGVSAIPCVVTDTDDAGSGLLALLENVQRENLNFFEEAEGLRAVIENGGLSQSEAAALVGKTQPTVANKLRLLALDSDIQRGIIAAGLTERHARALLTVDPDKRADVLNRIVAQGLNVAQTEALISRMSEEKPRRQQTRGAIKDLKMFDNSLQNAVKTLRRCGIRSQILCREKERWVEYTVKIMCAAPSGKVSGAPE